MQTGNYEGIEMTGAVRGATRSTCAAYAFWEAKGLSACRRPAVQNRSRAGYLRCILTASHSSFIICYTNRAFDDRSDEVPEPQTLKQFLNPPNRASHDCSTVKQSSIHPSVGHTTDLQCRDLVACALYDVDTAEQNQGEARACFDSAHSL